MAKPGVAVPEVGGPAQAACPCPGSLFPHYPPPRGGAGVRRRRSKQCLQVGAALRGAAVESMRASSPTHARAAAALAAGADDDDERERERALARAASWAARHPSALARFEQIAAASEGKRVVVFLDYDGTLSPIVDDPDAAFMSEAMRAAVRGVARHFPTAIVSGRCRDKVFGFVRLAELYYAGSHGMDIRGPAAAAADANTRPSSSRRHATSRARAAAKKGGGGGGGVVFQAASEFLPMIERVHERLAAATRGVPGARVENNKFCVSVHFRCVDEEMWGELAETVKGVLREYPRLRLTQGRMVLEVRPTIKWDKGKALEFLLRSLGFADCSNVLPVYIGDDRTDEDAFKVLCVLRRRGPGQGVGILVSKHPKETSASYSLQEPAEVMEFLLRLVEWKRLSRASLRMQQQ